MGIRVSTAGRLGEPEVAAVRALAGAVERRDGQPPLSDQALTQLGGTGVRHLLARDGERLVGYAQLGGDSLELLTDPAVALGPLLDAAEAVAPATLLVWSHGTRSPLAPALESRGYRRARVLHQLRRPLEATVELAPLAAGVEVRTFMPGRDEDAWLRVNAAAFADHAEQGRWTRADLDAREAEPWFDPAGFLVAERRLRSEQVTERRLRSGQVTERRLRSEHVAERRLRSEHVAERDDSLLGFHWTKVHADGAGEVYVLGVAPSAQRLGLGAALLTRGLAHLAEHGCRTVLLYVDESNQAAMRLYERAGFARHELDIQFVR